MLNFFRISSVLEGLSYLVILCVSFGIISRDFVFVLGMTHGALFALYFILSLIVSHKQGWSVITWLLVLVASIVPFAFILVDVFLRKEQLKAKENA